MVGNTPKYDNMDVFLSFLYVNDSTSRLDIVKNVGIGEGTARTVLGLLKARKFIDSTQKGHILTRKGKEFREKINQLVTAPRQIVLREYDTKKSIAMHLKTSKKIDFDVALRDRAIKEGADGALILHYDSGLKFPAVDYDKSFDYLENDFELKKNNLLVISFADDYTVAQRACLSVASEVSDEFKEILKKF